VSARASRTGAKASGRNGLGKNGRRSSPGGKVDKSAKAPRWDADAHASARRIVSVVEQLIPALGEALGPRTEIVLHDLTKLPNSIAAIANPITGREVGGPASDVGLEILQSGWSEHLINYRSELEDGTTLRSSSLFLKDEQGRAVCALCINTDISSIDKAKEALEALTEVRELSEVTDAVGAERVETFPRNIDDLAKSVLRDAIADSGVPLELMQKRHKVAVVGELQRRGFFVIRDAVDLAAAALGISRYSIYNYLNEIEAAERS
jgi:predicted transcriptional regulator YheO